MKEKKYLLIIIFLLMLFSLINNYSASFIMENYHNYLIKELIWYIVSFGIIFLMMKVNIALLNKYSFYLYLFGNFLLVITLIMGSNVNGSTSWLRIGPFSFQACEFMKIVLILYLAYFTKKYKMNDFRYVLLTLIIILIPSVLTFLEPETGTVISYLIIYLAFLIMRGLNKWWYIGSTVFIFGLIIAFGIFYYGFHDMFIKYLGTSFFYRMDRISEFINGEGMQLNNALVVIGSAGIWGHGVGKVPYYFPEAPTDFAFALLISNIGISGVLCFLIIYSFLFFVMIKILNKQNKLIVFPIILVLFFQFAINILMVIGLFPIVGITLPFISYGGSSLLSYMILIALVLENKRLKY